MMQGKFDDVPEAKGFVILVLGKHACQDFRSAIEISEVSGLASFLDVGSGKQCPVGDAGWVLRHPALVERDLLVCGDGGDLRTGPPNQDDTQNEAGEAELHRMVNAARRPRVWCSAPGKERSRYPLEEDWVARGTGTW